MNYRHAFHAGNFADVIKHIVLVRILTYLQDKPAAFRVIDTHAGAGVYDLACTVPGATTHPLPIEVVPGLPASLVISPNPTKSLYSIGSVVTIETRVADQYGNPIEVAPTEYASIPGPSATLGSNHFQYLSNGFYTLRATVDAPTVTGQPLVSQIQIEVGGAGPRIECYGPTDGAMLDVPLRQADAVHGVLCLEHVGSRRTWTVDEQNFAISTANLIAVAIADARQSEALRRVAESDARAHLILDTAHDAFVGMDSTGAIVIWNAQAETTFGWSRYVGERGKVIGMETFGASAPLKELQKKFGFEPDNVVRVAKEVLGRTA